MNLRKIWAGLLSFVFLFNLIAYPEIGMGKIPVYLVGVDLSSREAIGFMFSQRGVKDSDRRYPLKYFFTTLVVPNDELWVNLSPRSTEVEIIGDGISNTDLGRLLLYYDVMLKRDVERLMEIYGEEVAEQIGNLSEKRGIRFWVEPGVVSLRVYHAKALIESALLEVKVEVLEDGGDGLRSWLEKRIVPALRTRINNAVEYQDLRSAYASMILAQWCKRRFKRDMAFGEYINTKAKGPGIVSNRIWFKGRYLEEYARMYFEGYDKAQTGLWFVMGGIRGEVNEDEIIERKKKISQKPEIQVVDLEKLWEGIKQEIIKDRANILRDKKKIEEIIEGLGPKNKKEVDGEEKISDLVKSYAGKTVWVENERRREVGVVSLDNEELVLVNLGALSNIEEFERSLKIFFDRLRKNRKTRLVIFVDKSVVEEQDQTGASQFLLLSVLYLAKRMSGKVILVREPVEFTKPDFSTKIEFWLLFISMCVWMFILLPKREALKMISMLAIFGVIYRFIIQKGEYFFKGDKAKDECKNEEGYFLLREIWENLPLFVVLRQGVLLFDGEVVELREDVKENIRLSEIGRKEIYRCFPIDAPCVLLKLKENEPVLEFPLTPRRPDMEGKIISYGDVLFVSDTLDRMIDAFLGRSGKKHNYFWVEKISDGRLKLSVCDPKLRREWSPSLTVVDITPEGIKPSFLYDEKGAVVGILSPITRSMWDMISEKVKPIIDKEIRERYCGDKEVFATGVINIGGVDAIRLRGMQEEELKEMLRKILNYGGDRDIYLWVCPTKDGKYVLRFQGYRSLIYDPVERDTWALLRFNHQNAHIEIVRKGMVEEGDLYRIIGEIKRRFIPHIRNRLSGLRVRTGRDGKKEIVGKEFYLEEGMGICLSMKNETAYLLRRKDEIVLYTQNGIERISMATGGRILLTSDFTVVRDLAGFGDLAIEVKRDGFVSVISFKKNTDLSIFGLKWEPTDSVKLGKGEIGLFRYTNEIGEEEELVIEHGRAWAGKSEIAIWKDGKLVVNFVLRKGEQKFLNPEFNLTTDPSEAEITVSQENDRIKVTISEDRKGGVLSSPNWTTLPEMSCRDVIYIDRKIDFTFFPNTDFFFDCFDGTVITKGTSEYIVVDWDRDKKLNALYEEIVKRLIKFLQDKGKIKLSKEECRSLTDALVHADRTAVEEILGNTDGRVKGWLLRSIYQLVGGRVSPREFKREEGDLFFVGDILDSRGVCRHTAFVIGAILERLIKSGILLGRAYWIGHHGHAFGGYMTSAGYFLVLDPLSEYSGPITKRGTDDVIYEIYQITLGKVGFRIARGIETNVDNGISTRWNALPDEFFPPWVLQNSTMDISLGSEMKGDAEKSRDEVKGSLLSKGKRHMGASQREDFRPVEARTGSPMSLQAFPVVKDGDEQNGEEDSEIDEIFKKIPNILKEELERRFFSGRWPEGPIYDVVKFLPYLKDEKTLRGDNKISLEEIRGMRENISKKIKENLGEDAENEFVVNWKKIEGDNGIPETKKLFRILSLMWAYKVASMDHEAYWMVVRSVAIILDGLLEEGNKGKVKRAIDDLAWYSRIKNEGERSGKEEKGKGGMVLSLESLVVV